MWLIIIISITVILFSELFYYSEGRYATACNSTPHCEIVLENSVCSNHRCQCKPDHFLGQDDNKTLCIPCPALGEHCATVQCCRHSSYLVCSEGFCRCRNSYDGIYCWNANSAETVQFESIAQMILGLALVFTIAVLGSLVWKLCSRQDINRNSQAILNRDTSFASLNSIQRLVLIRLQDRPPPYNSSQQPWKYYTDPPSFNNQNISVVPVPLPSEAPPPYTVTVTSQVPITLSQHGVDNPVFSVEETQDQLIQPSTPTGSSSSSTVNNVISSNNSNENLSTVKDTRSTNQSKSPDQSDSVTS